MQILLLQKAGVNNYPSAPYRIFNWRFNNMLIKKSSIMLSEILNEYIGMADSTFVALSSRQYLEYRNMCLCINGIKVDKKRYHLMAIWFQLTMHKVYNQYVADFSEDKEYPRNLVEAWIPIHPQGSLWQNKSMAYALEILQSCTKPWK